MIELAQSGDKRIAKLHKLREQIGAVEQQLDELAHAPLTEDEILDRIRGEITEPLAQFRLAVAQRAYPGPAGPLVPEPIFVGGGDVPVSSRGGVDPLTVVFAMLGEEQAMPLLRALVRQVHPDLDGAVSMRDRTERRRQLEDVLTELLDREEAEIITLENQGLLVDRRMPADDAAVDRFLDALERAG